MARFCSNCGNEVGENAAFCVNCGYELAKQETAPVVEATPVVEEAPVVEETPVAEEAPVTEEAPVVEEPPITEEIPTPEATPVAEEIPVVVLDAPKESTAEMMGLGNATPATPMIIPTSMAIIMGFKNRFKVEEIPFFSVLGSNN